MLSHLSSHFEHIEGRNGAHQLLNGVQHGNPVRSSCIAELRQGYCNAMRDKGVCQGAAVPVSFEQASQIIRCRQRWLAAASIGCWRHRRLRCESLSLAHYWRPCLPETAFW